MKPEEAKKKLLKKDASMTSVLKQIRVMEAYLRGEPIEVRHRTSPVWKPTDNPFWNWASYDYRVADRRDKLKIDQQVLVRDSDGDHWQHRHFSFYSKHQKGIYCWASGQTSWSLRDNVELTCYWEQWKLPDEEVTNQEEENA